MKRAWNRQEALVWGAVVVLTLVGGALRLSGLERAAIPGDELEVWRIFQQGRSAWAILRGEIEHVISPFLPALIRAFADVLGLERNVLALRLPLALLGTLSIPLAFLAGRLARGTLAGLAAAALLALNAVHIQASREAYPYGLSMTGASLLLVGILWLARHGREGRRPGLGFYLALGLGFLFMFNASIAAWPIAGFFALLFIAQMAWMLKQRWSWRQFLPLAVTLVLLALIAGPQVLDFLAATAARGSVKNDMASQLAPGLKLVDPEGFGFLANFTWGRTWLGLLMLAVSLALVGRWLWVQRRDRAVWALAALLAGGFLTTMVSRYLTGNPFATRFLVPLLPAYVVLIAAGFGEAAGRRPARVRPGVYAALGLVALALMVRPAVWASQSAGRDVPYREVVAWADAHLAAGTPVLCHRFFDPWNEFRVNPATNAVFMSTMPNEPPERYRAENWRGTAQAFLERHRDAVFYESRFYWREAGIWDWPATFFARKQHFVDAAYVKLDGAGLLYRPYAADYPRDWFGADIYYNLPEDLVAQARGRGEPGLVLFDQGWAYHKDWTNLRDWRMMGPKATLRILNATDQPQRARLWLEGGAPERDKALVAEGGLGGRFAANTLARVPLGVVALEPGYNRVTLTDPQWSQVQVPLLVHAAGIEME